MTWHETHVHVPGGIVWSARTGPETGIPVLLIHGGPGAASYYLESLADQLASYRPVVLYDQLGCGRSDKPDDPSLWTVDRSVAEIEAVRNALSLNTCHIFGHSWGGWLAIDYLARRPPGIEAIILASTSASISQFVVEARKLIAELPEPHRSIIVELGARGDYAHPDYHAAADEFYRRHFCRLPIWPDGLMRTSDEAERSQVYHVMNGPTEFDVIGTLRDWDRSSDLRKILEPALVTCGRYDEIPPACSAFLATNLPNARMHVFELSAHCAHLEEPEEFVRVIESFLSNQGSAAN